MSEKTAFVRPKLRDIPFAGESDPDYDAKARGPAKQVTEVARRNAGVIQVGKDWERTATPAQREARRLDSLKREKKTDKKVIQDGNIVAKYKIEVRFEKGRTVTGPNLVSLTLWESGKLFSGGGDESMFFCKDGTRENGEGCWSPIFNTNIRGGIAWCPTCNKAVDTRVCSVQKSGKVTTRNLANELVKLFNQLESSVDVYVKYDKSDPHFLQMMRNKGRAVAERLKGLHIYTLKGILRDTAGGANLSDRFYAFLTA